MAISRGINIDNNVNDYVSNREYFLLKSNLDDISVQYAPDKLDISQKQILSNEKRTIFGYMLGEIYDLSKKDLVSKGHVFNTNTDIEYVIHLYEEYGEGALEKLNGKFVICLLDKENDEILIINDRYGFYTFYCYKEDESFCFCNLPKIIADSLQKKSINFKSVQDFFSYGYLLGDKTLINEINKVPPASIIKVKKREIKFRSYWNWNYIKKARNVRYEEAVEKLGVLWIEAVKKIIMKHEKVYMTLSGGLDSRAILAAIDYLGMNHKVESAITFGIKDCLDFVLASQAAKAAKVKHIFIELNADLWWNNIVSSIDNVMAENSIIHGHGSCLKLIPPKYIFLNGFAGDLVLGGSFLKKELIDNNESYILSYLEENLKADGLENRFAIKGINGREIDDATVWKSTDYFFINNRVKNFTNCNINGDTYYRAYPFFDNDLIEYVYSLPQEWRLDSKIYKAMLLKYFPKFYQDISWHKTGLPIGIDDEDLDKKEKNNQYATQDRIDVIFFGASKLGKRMLFNYKDKWNIRYFSDNDPNKWGKTIMGVKVIPPFEIKELNYRVVITSMYEDEIENQLKEIGIQVYYRASELMNYVNYKKWMRESPAIRETIVDILEGDQFKNGTYFNIDEIDKIVKNYIKNNGSNFKDICLLYTFKIFYKRYIEAKE